MAGILLYIYVLVTGFLYAQELFREKDIYYRAWMGGCFGNVLLMSGIIPFAALFGFSITAHIIFAIAVIVPYIIIRLKRKNKPEMVCSSADSGMTNRIFIFLILPISVLIWILMTNHILAPYPGGGVSSGQSTYGDLHMHLSFITSIAEQGKFPPDYCQLAGEKLNYPFLVDMLSSSLYLFGTPLRWATLIPSYVLSMLIVLGFYMLAYRITKKKSVAVLACVLFFINGGFGFAYFFDGMRKDFSGFSRIFTEYYKTPTNYLDGNIRWVNTICDMIIPQRVTMAGWSVLLLAIMLLLDAIEEKKKSLFIILGVLAGCMPMIHTHSFLALGIISAVMFFAYFSKDKTYITSWVIYGAIAMLMAFPQLFVWTFTQTSGNEMFVRASFNWINDTDTYFWFYLKNWGIIAIFAIPAIMHASKDNKKLALSVLTIMLIAEFIIFQPNEYDNNKLIFVTYMIVLILVCDYMYFLYRKLEGVSGRSFFATVIVCAAVLSGILTIGREYVSGKEYRTFADDDIEFAEYVKDNTASDAVFLTGQEVTNPITVFAGRTIYLGSASYVYFHGFTKENSVRSEEVKAAYEGSAQAMENICSDNGISYIYVGASERMDYKINEEMLGSFEKVYTKGNNSLYKVN